MANELSWLPHGAMLPLREVAFTMMPYDRYVRAAKHSDPFALSVTARCEELADEKEAAKAAKAAAKAAGEGSKAAASAEGKGEQPLPSPVGVPVPSDRSMEQRVRDTLDHATASSTPGTQGASSSAKGGSPTAAADHRQPADVPSDAEAKAIRAAARLWQKLEPGVDHLGDFGYRIEYLLNGKPDGPMYDWIVHCNPTYDVLARQLYPLAHLEWTAAMEEAQQKLLASVRRTPGRRKLVVPRCPVLWEKAEELRQTGRHMVAGGALGVRGALSLLGCTYLLMTFVGRSCVYTTLVNEYDLAFMQGTEALLPCYQALLDVEVQDFGPPDGRPRPTWIPEIKVQAKPLADKAIQDHLRQLGLAESWHRMPSERVAESLAAAGTKASVGPAASAKPGEAAEPRPKAAAAPGTSGATLSMETKSAQGSGSADKAEAQSKTATVAAGSLTKPGGLLAPRPAKVKATPTQTAATTTVKATTAGPSGTVAAPTPTSKVPPVSVPSFKATR